MKNQKNLLIAAGIIILAIAAIIIVLKNHQSVNWNNMILFYGDTCPHCKVVEKYISHNNVAAHFKFEKLEVFHNKTNAALLGRYAKHCNLNTQNIGVPFFWTGQKCLIGEDKVINYFKGK